MNLWIIFLTGLTVGGLTCLAVQGGLLASVIASREKENLPGARLGFKKAINKTNTIFPTIIFLASKLLSHIVLGFLLGAFGNSIGINQTIQISIQFAAGLYMIIVALNLLEIHPIFRYALIQPPRFIARKLRNKSRSKDMFAPIFLGCMTVFIPCGTTLAIEALAISSANAFIGAAIMAAFILGTMPLFFGIGWITTILGDNFRTKFLKITAVALIYLGLNSVNGAFIAGGIPLNSHTLSETVKSVTKSGDKPYTNIPVSQNAEIVVTSGGYNPDYIKVRKGVPVKLKLIGMNNYSCASAFRIPSLGITKNLSANETYIVNFTPEKKGKFLFTCSMGMYTGIIEII